MINELRIYEIFDNNSAAFHARFRDHAARLMRDHGFNILAMWETRTDKRLEFVYLLAWPDEATRDAAWDRFMANDEWAAIKRETAAEHGSMVGEIEGRILRPVDYSAALSGS